jgi:hypothetical protein
MNGKAFIKIDGEMHELKGEFNLHIKSPIIRALSVEADGYEFKMTGEVSMINLSSGKELSQEEMAEFFSRNEKPCND